MEALMDRVTSAQQQRMGLQEGPSPSQGRPARADGGGDPLTSQAGEAMAGRIASIEVAVERLYHVIQEGDRMTVDSREDESRRTSRRRAESHLTRTPSEIDNITKKESDFLKFVIENVEEWSVASLVGVLRARRDYAIAAAVYGTAKARRIFDEEDEDASLLMKRMAAINAEEQVLKEAAALARQGAAMTSATATAAMAAAPTGTTAYGGYNCGRNHLVRDCPNPFDIEYRTRHGTMPGVGRGRGRGQAMAPGQDAGQWNMGRQVPVMQVPGPSWIPGQWNMGYAGAPGYAPVQWMGNNNVPASDGRPTNAAPMSGAPAMASPQQQ